MNIVGFVALLPFLVLSMIAPGTMADVDSNGRPTLVICSGQGPLRVIVQVDGSVPSSDKSGAPVSHAAQDCPWAFHAHLVVNSLPAVLGAMIRIAAPVGSIAAMSEHEQRVAVLGPSTRGPPSGFGV